MLESPKVNQLRVAIFPTDAAPHLANIDATLEAKQAVVGGLIAVFPTLIPGVFGICNDEGLLNGSAFNFASLPFGAHICGTFILCSETRGPEGTDFTSLSAEQQRLVQLSPFWPEANPDDD